MDEAKIACSGFVVSCCQSSGTFEFVETPFDLIAQGIEETIKRDWLLAVSPSWNYRSTALIGDVFANVIRIIATIGEKHLGWRQFTITKQVKTLVVGKPRPR